MKALSRSAWSFTCLSFALAVAATPVWAGKPDKWEKHGGKHEHGDHDGQGEHPRYIQQAPAVRSSSNVSVQINIGGYFQDNQRVAAREYYEPQFREGRCPPGLAKKNNGCMPPGQAKKWRKGYRLPSDVVYYPVPAAVSVRLGAPPSGYKYVRVAADILLIAVGTSMVVDAIEDLSR